VLLPVNHGPTTVLYYRQLNDMSVETPPQVMSAPMKTWCRCACEVCACLPAELRIHSQNHPKSGIFPAPWRTIARIVSVVFFKTGMFLAFY
jgi:hypothetical protein